MEAAQAHLSLSCALLLLNLLKMFQKSNKKSDNWQS